MAEPSLVIKVNANIEGLRKSMNDASAALTTTKRDMSAMAAAFDGSKIISQASAVTAQIAAIGGATKLTAAEQARANAILEAALEKYQALGKEAPPGMQALAEATRGVAAETEATSAQVGGLNGELQKFDGILSAMGINLSGPIKAIGEIGQMSGKSVKDIGLLGSAGAALGAGMAGWKVGRMAAEFFDLDTKIANATAKLMGYGDVAAQTAGAKADALNGTLSYQINLLKQAAQAGNENNAVLSQAALEWNFEASAVQEATETYVVHGDVINGIIQSTGENIHAVEAYRSEMKLTTGVIQEQTAALDENAKRLKTKADAAKAAADAEKDAAADRKKFLDSLAHTTEIKAMSDAELGNIRRSRGTNSDENIWRKLKELETAETRGPRGMFEGVITQEQYVAANAQLILLAQLRMWAQGKERPPGFANGVNNFGGGMAVVGERGPELVHLPRGADVIPNHQLGGGSVTFAPVLNFHGPVVGTSTQFQDMVTEALLNVYRKSGRPLPV